MKKKICQYLSKLLVEVSEEELLKTMEIPPEEKMGDYALNVVQSNTDQPKH